DSIVLEVYDVVVDQISVGAEGQPLLCRRLKIIIVNRTIRVAASIPLSVIPAEAGIQNHTCV
ncbi:MAG: hypothetical protein ACYS29_00740, partial [Planctomycetota bacterium]